MTDTQHSFLNPYGLIYIDNFISLEEETSLLEMVDRGKWRETRHRNMQAYGFQYLKGEHHMALHKVEPIPEAALSIIDRIREYNKDLFFNQMTVNRYLPGQGIDAHYDHIERFGDAIAGLTLGSGSTIIFEGNGEVEELYLKARSLYIMSGKYRYKMTHKIRKVHYDNVDGVEIKRGVRTSLTFRSV